MSSEAPMFSVGLALRVEKARKHVSVDLVQQALGAGIRIVILDEFAPLEDQGPLDVVLQKIRRQEWEDALEVYVRQHPHTRVIDPPSATHPLRNRGLMLSPFRPGFVCAAPAGAAAGPRGIRCCVPPHAVLDVGVEAHAAQAQLDAAGLRYPVLAKSLFADGREGSHAIAAIHSAEGLRQLVQGEAPQGFAPPVLVEQYIDHGNCLFKVYVLGEEAVPVTRPSLRLHVPQTAACAPPAGQASGGGDAEEAPPGSSPSVPTPAALAAAAAAATPDLELISRVSAYPRRASWGKDDLAPRGHGVPALPRWLCSQVAARIASQLGLSLFNFDLIVPLAPPPGQRGLAGGGAAAATQEVEEEGLVHLIDINYFPGYEKLPGYEALMVRFLSRLRDQAAATAAAVG